MYIVWKNLQLLDELNRAGLGGDIEAGRFFALSFSAKGWLNAL